MTKYEHPSYFSFALISVGICCGSGAKGSMGMLRLAQSSRQTQPSQPRIEKKITLCYGGNNECTLRYMDKNADSSTVDWP